MGDIVCADDASGRAVGQPFVYRRVAAAEVRRGIGGQLADRCLSAMKEAGIAKVALLVFKRNEAGNAFWERQGFVLREDVAYRNRELIKLTRIDT